MSLIKRLRKKLKTTPYLFQRKGIRFIKENGGRAFIGDDMGLGKTIQLLGWLAVNPNKRPVLIVVPANAKYNWKEQVQQHTHMKCQVLSGRKPYPLKEEIIIINYDIVMYWESFLVKQGFSVLAGDESHMLKNQKAKRTKACQRLAHKSPHVIFMSGTPIKNRPVEFFAVLNMIKPDLFPNFWKFAHRYCDPKPSKWKRGFDFNGATNLDELHEILQPFFLRRMKKEVLKELPTKQRTILPVDISNRSEYSRATNYFLNWYRGEAGEKVAKRAKKAQALVKLGQLKQLVAKGKLDTAYEWIDSFLESTDEKLVVFVYHRNIFDAITKKYKSIAAQGGRSGAQRQKEVNKFQKNKKCRLFIGTIGADKEAITLTAARTVLFLELGWTPGEHDQAEDRVNRIGQRYNKVNIYYILGRKTIDGKIWKVLEKKREIIDQVIEGKSQRILFVDFDSVINSLKGEASG